MVVCGQLCGVEGEGVRFFFCSFYFRERERVVCERERERERERKRERERIKERETRSWATCTYVGEVLGYMLVCRRLSKARRYASELA